MPSYRGKSLEYILSLLENTQTLEERLSLLEALGKFRNNRAAQPLIEALGDENPRIRAMALYSLVRMHNKHAVGPLLARLGDSPSTDVIYRLVSDLGRLRDKRTIEPLAKLLDHPDKTVQVLTASALGQIKDEKAIPYLIQALGSETTRVWEAAERGLKHLGKQAVEPLIEALRSENPRLRSQAASIIDDPRAVEPLIETLKDSEPVVRRSVARTLGYLQDERAIKPLIDSISDPDDGVRKEILAVLGRFFGSKAKQAFEPLMKILSDKTNSSDIRSAAIWTIGRIDATNPLIRNSLIEAFNEVDFELRLDAAVVLGKHDPSFTPAIDFLFETLSNTNWLNRCHVIDALGEIPTVVERSIGPLVETLFDSNEIIRLSAAFALGELMDARALPALEQLLEKERDAEVADKVREAIGKIKEQG